MNGIREAEKVNKFRNMASGHWRRQIYDRERWEKKLGDDESGDGDPQRNPLLAKQTRRLRPRDRGVPGRRLPPCALRGPALSAGARFRRDERQLRPCRAAGAGGDAILRKSGCLF